ncbi:MAG: hypothetical protein J5854_05380 [Clostridia bacterium]|nr:hypothetical protein [Clostridia bacterium]
MKKGVTKKEYLRLVRRTETALRRELKKPDAERDAALVSECVESLSYYRRELIALRRESSGFSAVLRPALAAVLAVVFTFVVGASVAQAAGFRVWTAIFRHDAGYLRVDYVPETTVMPSDHAGWEDAERSFYDHDAFAAELERNGFYAFLDEWNGFEFVDGGVRSTQNEYYASFTMFADEGYIRVRMIAKRRIEDKTSVWGLKDDIPAVHLEINGVDAAYQVDGGYAFATWQDGNMIFAVSVYDTPEMIEPLLYELVGRRPV